MGTWRTPVRLLESGRRESVRRVVAPRSSRPESTCPVGLSPWSGSECRPQSPAMCPGCAPPGTMAEAETEAGGQQAGLEMDRAQVPVPGEVSSSDRQPMLPATLQLRRACHPVHPGPGCSPPQKGCKAAYQQDSTPGTESTISSTHSAGGEQAGCERRRQV